MKKLLCMFVVLCLCSCGTETKDKPKLGKYVYIDSQGILHVKNPCVLGLQRVDEHGEDKWDSVRRLEISKLQGYSISQSKTCAWCVGDEEYELLEEVSNAGLKKANRRLKVEWDGNKSIYTNGPHGIEWRLPRYSNWTKRPILSDGTIFKMRDEDNLVLVSIDVNSANGKKMDAWEFIDYYKSPGFVNTMKETALLSETAYIDSKATKETICGLHANKLVIEYEIAHPGYPAGYYRLAHQYQLCNGGNVYTFCITGLYLQKADYKDFDEVANEIIKGLYIDIL